MIHLQEFSPEDGQEKLYQKANSEYGIKKVITMALIDNGRWIPGASFATRNRPPKRHSVYRFNK